MAKKYTPTAGLRNVGSYQVSGTPFVTSSTITEGDEIRIPFPSVTNNIAVQLSLSPARGPFGLETTSTANAGAMSNTELYEMPTYSNKSFSVSFWGKSSGLGGGGKRFVGCGASAHASTERFYIGVYSAAGTGTWQMMARSWGHGLPSQAIIGRPSMAAIAGTPTNPAGGKDVLLEWCFWTWVVDPLSYNLYINSVLVATLEAGDADWPLLAAGFPTTNRSALSRFFGIGDPNNEKSENQKMTYSDVVVWNNVLSPQQIAHIYISGSSGFDYDFPLTGAYWQGQELPAPWTSSSVGMLSYDWGIGAQSVGAGGYVSDPVTPSAAPVALTNQNGATMADGWNYIGGPRGLKFAAAITSAEYWSLRVPPGWISSTGGTVPDPTPSTGETYNIYYYTDLSDKTATGTDIKIQEGATAADNAARTIMAINGTADTTQVKFSSDYLRINGIPGFSGSLSPLYSSDAVDIMVEPGHEEDLVAKAPYVCVLISGTIGNEVGWYAQNQDPSYTDADQWQKGWFNATPLVEPLSWYQFNTQSATLATGGGYFADTDREGVWPTGVSGTIHNRSQSPAAIARGASGLVIGSKQNLDPGKQEYTLGYGGVAGGAGIASMSLKSTGSYPDVLTNKHYWKLENKNDKLTMNIKTKEIYLSATGGDCLYSVQADLTTISTGSMFELTGEGIDS